MCTVAWRERNRILSHVEKLHSSKLFKNGDCERWHVGSRRQTSIIKMWTFRKTCLFLTSIIYRRTLHFLQDITSTRNHLDYKIYDRFLNRLKTFQEVFVFYEHNIFWRTTNSVCVWGRKLCSCSTRTTFIVSILQKWKLVLSEVNSCAFHAGTTFIAWWPTFRCFQAQPSSADDQQCVEMICSLNSCSNMPNYRHSF